MSTLQPGLEIRWGKSISDPEQRKLLRPKLAKAGALAISGLAEFGMELNDRKYAVVHAVGRAYPDRAEATTAKTMQLYLPPADVMGRITNAFWSPRLAHELMHQLREAKQPSEIMTVGGLAAAEAVAYKVEDEFNEREFSSRYPSPLRQVYERQDELPALYEQLRADFNRLLWDEEIHRKWLLRKRAGHLRPIDLAGIGAMLEQVARGHTAERLWAAPAPEVLGFEADEAAA